MTPLMADHPSGAGEPVRRSSVKARLTPNRQRRAVENDEYARSSDALCAPTPGEWQPATWTPWPT